MLMEISINIKETLSTFLKMSKNLLQSFLNERHWEKNIIVFDFDGDTCSASLINIDKGIFE